MGILLQDADEYTHTIGSASNWNESRYIDFWDARARVGGWFRIGNRPNEQHAEMSACINLPDGSAAFMFARPTITGNTLEIGGQRWQIDSPWDVTHVSYEGEMILLADPWRLVDPKVAFKQSPRVHAAIELTTRAQGLESVMGFDQDHIDRIFLPGQADFHYQHLIRTTGRVRVGDRHFDVAGRGGKDHSWGPRNWHAKIYLRWLIASFDDDHGFMLVRAVGPTKKTRSGYVWDAGKFHLVDDFRMHNEYAGQEVQVPRAQGCAGAAAGQEVQVPRAQGCAGAVAGAPHFELRKTTLEIISGARTWRATGMPQGWLPLRHRQTDAQGKPALLRIVKSPTDWIASDGRQGEGMCEYHDLMIDGKPVGLDD